jgi:hypothetical protein
MPLSEILRTTEAFILGEFTCDCISGFIRQPDRELEVYVPEANVDMFVGHICKYNYYCGGHTHDGILLEHGILRCAIHIFIITKQFCLISRLYTLDPPPDMGDGRVYVLCHNYVAVYGGDAFYVCFSEEDVVRLPLFSGFLPFSLERLEHKRS